MYLDCALSFQTCMHHHAQTDYWNSWFAKDKWSSSLSRCQLCPVCSHSTLHLWHRPLITTSVTAHIQDLDFTLANNISCIGFACVYICILVILLLVLGEGGRDVGGEGMLRACSACGGQRATLESQISPSTFTRVWAIGLRTKAWAPSAFTCRALSPALTLSF